MKVLIAELNDLLAANAAEFATIGPNNRLSWVADRLSAENAGIFTSLPDGVANQLCLDRDPHGNVQVSLIETEKLLGHMVARRLDQMKSEGRYVGKFAAQFHFFGYEGRCADPPTSTPTTATLSDSTLHASSVPVSPDTCRACATSPSLPYSGLQVVYLSP